MIHIEYHSMCIRFKWMLLALCMIFATFDALVGPHMAIHDGIHSNWPPVAFLFMTIDAMANPFIIYLSSGYLTSMRYGDSSKDLQTDEARSKLLKRFDQCKAVSNRFTMRRC